MKFIKVFKKSSSQVISKEIEDKILKSRSDTFDDGKSYNLTDEEDEKDKLRILEKLTSEKKYLNNIKDLN